MRFERFMRGYFLANFFGVPVMEWSLSLNYVQTGNPWDIVAAVLFIIAWVACVLDMRKKGWWPFTPPPTPPHQPKRSELFR